MCRSFHVLIYIVLKLIGINTYEKEYHNVKYLTSKVIVLLMHCYKMTLTSMKNIKMVQ